MDAIFASLLRLRLCRVKNVRGITSRFRNQHHVTRSDFLSPLPPVLRGERVRVRGDSIPRDYSPNSRIAPGIFRTCENRAPCWWAMVDHAPLPPDPLDDSLRSRGIPSPLTLTLSPGVPGGEGTGFGPWA